MNPSTLVAIVQAVQLELREAGSDSVGRLDPDDLGRLAELVSNVGQLAHVLDAARVGHCSPDWGRIHEELVHVAARAAVWAQAVEPLVD